MTQHFEQEQRTDDGLMKAEPSPWTEPFQHTYETVWSDAAMYAADTQQAGSHAAETPMQVNQHMDDQTRNALSKIYYGH